MTTPKHPTCYRPIPGVEGMCWYWLYEYDDGDIPGNENFNFDQVCSKYKVPCPSDGLGKEAKP